MNRNQRKTKAEETLEILESGKYSVNGKEVDISWSMAECLKQTFAVTPDNHTSLEISERFESTIFGVANETTLEGLGYCHKKYPGDSIGVLNFASAKNPGGGFLSGSGAQEESLARSSGLYRSLMSCFDYYEYHRKQKNLLYSDYMIVSPQVPFFRFDNGDLYNEPILATVFTSPAVNKGAISQSELLEQIHETMVTRTKKLLTLAYAQKIDVLILGAWGCGVFRNDPAEIASIFKDVITGHFSNAFKEIRFSVLDRAGKGVVIEQFQKRF